jgi:hypothetical protein
MKEDQLKKQCSPYFASINYDPAQDTEQDCVEFSKKFIFLPKVIKYGFLSDEIESAIYDISNKYKIDDPQKVGEIARMVRGRFLDGQNENNWEDSAKSKVQVDEAKIQNFIDDIKSVVEKVQEVGMETLKESVEKLPIIPALKKYEKLGEQDITENQIEIEINDSREFVFPNVKNWLEDYIQSKGAQAHNNLERSDYLYKAKNTENLSTKERERLGTLLMSYDKDELLAINKEQQEILFDNTLDVLNQIDEQSDSTSVDVGIDKFQGGKGMNSIKLAPIAGLGETKKEEQNSNDSVPSEAKKEGVSKKSHEISWYGTNPFDGLEKINGEKTSVIENQKQEDGGSKMKNFQTKNTPQNTKHVIDLKNGS